MYVDDCGGFSEGGGDKNSMPLPTSENTRIAGPLTGPEDDDQALSAGVGGNGDGIDRVGAAICPIRLPIYL